MRYLSVRFALLMQDDYDGRVLREAGYRFTVNGKAVTPIRKPEGFSVFTNLEGDVFQITIQNSRYCEKRVTVDCRTLNPIDPVVRLRLCRSPRGSFGDCEYLTGTHLPGREIYALAEETPPLRLHKLQNRGEETVLTMQSYTVKPLKQLRFVMGKARQREEVFFGERHVDGSYTLLNTPQHAYKAGTPLLRAYWAECDGVGRYAIPIPKGIRENITKVQAFDREVGKWESL